MKFTQLVLILWLGGFPALCLAELAPFKRAQQLGSEVEAVFSWGDEQGKFMLAAKGVLTSKTGPAKPGLKLSISKHSWIEHLFVLNYREDLLLAFETYDGHEGDGYICRIKSGLIAVDWCQRIAGFNVYAALGKDSIYLGAIGFVGRINPENGKLLWRHDDLYNKDNTFNIVCPVNETDVSVTFHATTGIKGEVNKQITLDRKTGKIMQISVIDNKTVCQ